MSLTMLTKITSWQLLLFCTASAAMRYTLQLHQCSQHKASVATHTHGIAPCMCPPHHRHMLFVFISNNLVAEH